MARFCDNYRHLLLNGRPRYGQCYGSEGRSLEACVSHGSRGRSPVHVHIKRLELEISPFSPAISSFNTTTHLVSLVRCRAPLIVKQLLRPEISHDHPVWPSIREIISPHCPQRLQMVEESVLNRHVAMLRRKYILEREMVSAIASLHPITPGVNSGTIIAANSITTFQCLCSKRELSENLSPLGYCGFCKIIHATTPGTGFMLALVLFLMLQI
jgi:hypothetical protein